MVEELRRRLEFDNTSVSVHAVNGVYSQIIEKKKNLKIDKISSSTVEIAELKLLWDKCMDSNQVVGMACSEALLCLVQSGHAEYNYVINTVLNLIPSAKCLTSGLRLLSDLLLLQVTITLKQTKVKGYTCPFQLRTPPHPFISVLTSRPDSWPALLDQVQYLLQQDDDKLGVCCVILLRPFLKYVMLNPSPETSDRSFKTLLYSALLQLCAHQSSDTDETVICIIDFLVTITPLMQTQPLSVLTETVACLHSLVNFIIRHPDKLKTQLAAAAVNLLCVCKALLRTSGDLKSSLVLLVRISTVATLPTVAIMVLSDLLLNVPVIYFQDVLTVAKKTLSKSTSSCVHTVLVLPVLQAISTSQASVVMTTKQKTLVQSSAWDVLSLIEQCLKSDPHTEEIEMNVNITDPWFSKMSNLTKYVGKFQRYPEAAYDWLNAIQSELKKGDSIPDDVILLLAYLLVTSEQVLLDQCLTVISDVASKDVTKAPHFLSLLLYKLGRENDPELKIKLLYTIPSTGTHKACVGSILKTLQAFAAVPLMEAVAIRLMASLWKLQDRCFPYLQKLLTLVKTPDKSGTHGCDDKLVAKAATIRDVCRERPYQHVSEMLTAIHWFISEFTSPADGTVVVLALEGLYFLCKSEVVDIRTTWGAISSKFTTEDRPLVNSRICELFSLVPDLNVDTEDYEEFRDEVVTLLWCFAKNSHPMISGAAYSALSQFDEEEFRLDDLPENISSEVKAKVRAVRERERERRQITAEEEQEDEEEEDFDIQEIVTQS
ncbi:focadhesin-like [Ptychodera flava]|uniref:focadhesin-like n=1 Tax=Ptychodera flava TaxID=63121 RepID=UPI003969D953